jgi:diacylglycerol kinase (ATP)
MTHQINRILFVINKGSGRKKNIDWKQLIEEHFSKLQYTVDYFMMPVEDCFGKLKVRIGNFHPDLVVAVGGDGTVTLVAKLMLGTQIPMAILPAGSANGMAKELQIPEDPQKAIEIMLNGEEKATDVIRINDSEICLHLSDIGINAQLVKYFQQGSIRGKIGYALALVKALRRKKRMTVYINARHEEVKREASMLLIANASKYGTGATINPDGSIYDGVFEVVVVRGINLWQVTKMFLQFRRFNPKKIEFLQATSVRIETSRKMDFQVDGEYIGKVTKVEAKCMPGALKLIVPESTRDEVRSTK